MKQDWIDRRGREPEHDARILVWDETRGEVVSAKHDYESWVDVVNVEDLAFRFWMPAPARPTP